MSQQLKDVKRTHQKSTTFGLKQRKEKKCTNPKQNLSSVVDQWHWNVNQLNLFTEFLGLPTCPLLGLPPCSFAWACLMIGPLSSVYCWNLLLFTLSIIVYRIFPCFLPLLCISSVNAIFVIRCIFFSKTFWNSDFKWNVRTRLSNGQDTEVGVTLKAQCLYSLDLCHQLAWPEY